MKFTEFCLQIKFTKPGNDYICIVILLKSVGMRARNFVSMALGMLFTASAFVQGQEMKVKIVDLENVKTVVDNATTSSSTGMDDFPVYQNGVQALMHMDDLYMILVRHDQKASDPNLYVVVELLDMEHKSSIYEMARYMRFSGSSEAGPFSIKVKDINTIEVLRKGY